MQFVPAESPAVSRREPRRLRLFLALIAAVGPGVLGLAADNDAGGLLSYIVTGASRHLIWFVPALLVMAPVTYLIQELALRVAVATRAPFGRLMTEAWGPGMTRLSALVLHALNLLTLVSEFAGMTLALSLVGLPRAAGAALALVLVLAVTRQASYRRVERVLLLVAGLTFALVPIVVLLHPTPVRLDAAFFGGRSGSDTAFLLLALAGNAVAPWMIYWQQNAAWAGQAGDDLARGRLDIWIGIGVQLIMATAALLIGALAAPRGGGLVVPLARLTALAGPIGRDLFAIALFDAGFVAAATIGLSSAWMLRELSAPGPAGSRLLTPTGGAAGFVHGASLVAAALAVAWPGLSPAAVSLWAQAGSALWMPISLVFLARIARTPGWMGGLRLRGWTFGAIALIVAGFLTLAAWTVANLFR